MKLVTLKIEQNVINNRNGNYSIGYSPYFHMDVEGLDKEFATASKVTPKIIYPDDTATRYPGIGSSGATVGQPAGSTDLGYRLFRSTSKNALGISATDFYITGTSYADVNVEANTTYYYTVKPVI